MSADTGCAGCRRVERTVYCEEHPHTSEARNDSHYARPGQASFDERSYKLATLAVESFGRLGKEGSDLIDQVAASVAGGTDGSSFLAKERRLHRTLFPDNNLSNRPGCCFTPSAPAQTSTKKPPGGQGEEGRHRSSTDANDVGMECRRGVGSTRVCQGREAS